MNIKPTNSARAIYNKLAAARKQGQIVSESTLRLEATLNTAQQVNFNVLQNVGTPNTTEIRLNLPDAFVATSAFFGLLKVASGSTNNVNKLHTFPNGLIFSGSSEEANLHNLYNGYLQIKINQTTYIDKLDMYRFYRAGQAQESVLTAASGTGNAYEAGSWTNPEWGFAPLTPGVTFSGAKNNEVSIQTPASTAMAGTSSTNYAVLIFRGFLIQNGANLGY